MSKRHVVLLAALALLTFGCATLGITPEEARKFACEVACYGPCVATDTSEAGWACVVHPSPAPSPTPVPNPFPSATPTPAPTPKPSPSPSPSPSASPRPSPTPTPLPGPSPSPSSGTPQVDPVTQNYPMPQAGTCPAHFKGQFDRVGIRAAGSTPCQDGPNCVRWTLWATQKALPPFCPHAVGRRECEMWTPCQEQQFVDYVGIDDAGFGGNPPGIVMQISHPDWGNVWGRVDKQTCDPRHSACPPGMTNPVHNFNGHDKAKNRHGVTKARACMPDGTKCGETSYP